MCILKREGNRLRASTGVSAQLTFGLPDSVGSLRRRYSRLFRCCRTRTLLVGRTTFMESFSRIAGLCLQYWCDILRCVPVRAHCGCGGRGAKKNTFSRFFGGGAPGEVTTPGKQTVQISRSDRLHTWFVSSPGPSPFLDHLSSQFSSSRLLVPMPSRIIS